MDLKMLATVFTTIFIAELGDKTRFATFFFAADRDVNMLTVFFGASLALVIASDIGAVVGSAIAKFVSPRTLSYVAGTGFICIGIWTLATASRESKTTSVSVESRLPRSMS